MRFNCALNVAAYFSLNIVPQRSRCICPHLCLLRWPEAWIRWKNNSRVVRNIIKTLGHEATTAAVSIGPRSWWGLEQSVFWDFNRSMTGDRQKCTSLAMFFCCFFFVFFFKLVFILCYCFAWVYNSLFWYVAQHALIFQFVLSTTSKEGISLLNTSIFIVLVCVCARTPCMFWVCMYVCV